MYLAHLITSIFTSRLHHDIHAATHYIHTVVLHLQ